jgi:hypothetical protein
MFNAGDKRVHFFFDADYAGHLGDSSELAADAMVSFAGYPRPIAEKIFERRGIGGSWRAPRTLRKRLSQK